MVRFKHRYLLCEIVFCDGRNIERRLTELDVYRCVRGAVHKTHGDYGMAVLQSSLHVKYVNVHTHIALVRGRRGAHKMLWSAMTLIKKIGNYEAFFRMLHVGGSIRSCQKFLTNHHRKQLPVLLQACKSQEERQQVQMSIVKCSLDGGESKAVESQEVDSDSD